MNDDGRRQSTAREVRRRILGSRDRIWRVEEFDGSVDAVQSELRRLVKAGELEHLRRGVYWRGHRTRFGMTVASETQALRKVLGHQVAIGATGWHATNLLGLSTQVSPVEMLAITARPPAGFSHLKLVDRSRRVERREQRLNDLEITVLEALEGWDRYVEEPSERASARFRALLGRDNVRIERLVSAAKSEPAVVRERLRQVLEDGGWSAEADRIPRARSRAAKDRALAVFQNAASSPVVSTS
jgi:hypothetical protein